MRSLGLDIGNGFASVALVEGSGRIVRCFAPNLYFEDPDWGGAGMPTEAYVNDDGTILVGEPEVAGRCHREPWRAVRAVKRLLAEGEIRLEKDGDPVLDAYGEEQELTPGDVYSAIVARVVDLANGYLTEHGKDPVYDVVLAYPASFRGDAERDDADGSATNRLRVMRQSAERVVLGGHGVHVVRMIPEPAAVALDYIASSEMPPLVEGEAAVVYDLGYGTFDVALVTPSGDAVGRLDLIDSDSIEDLGCRDFDRRLQRYLAHRLAKEANFRPSSTADREDLRVGSLGVKLDLSQSATACYHGHADGGRPVRLEVRRSEFEKCTKDLLTRTLEKVSAMLASAHRQELEVRLVILAGGGSKMPMVERAVRDLMRVSLCPDAQIVRHSSPSDAVAYGAAREGAAYDGRDISPGESPEAEPADDGDHLDLNERARCAYGIWESRNHEVTLFMASGTKLPHTETRVYRSRADSISLRFFRTKGDHPLLGAVPEGECVSVRRFSIDVPPGEACRFDLTVRDDDGSLTVACTWPDGTTIVRNSNDPA